MAVVETDGSVWGRPKLLDPLNTPHDEGNPHISTDENFIFFTSDRPGGYGGQDLYYSKRIGGRWTKALNMGPGVNTEADEDQIWVTKDGLLAYFNRHGRFLTTRFQDGKWRKAESVSLDIPAGAYAAEASLTDDGQLMFFAMSDKERADIVFVYAKRKADGKWGPIQLVD